MLLDVCLVLWSFWSKADDAATFAVLPMAVSEAKRSLEDLTPTVLFSGGGKDHSHSEVIVQTIDMTLGNEFLSCMGRVEK